MQRRPVAGHTWALGAVAALVDTAREAAAAAVRLDVRFGAADEPFIALRDDGPGLSFLGVRSRLGATAPSVVARIRDGNPVADPTPAQLPTPEKGFAGTPWLGAVFRLGRDVCLLSKTGSGGSDGGGGGGGGVGGPMRIIALLSRTGAADGSLTTIVVVDWDRNLEEKAAAMPSLLKYSPWDSEEEIGAAFDSIGTTGLLVAVFNLRRTVEEAVLELDVESDETDILLDPPEDPVPPPGDPTRERGPMNPLTVQPLTVHTSMRAYLQVLYLESSSTELKPGRSRGPRIYLRGKIVREMRVCASLLQPFDMEYTPRKQPGDSIRCRFGINSCYAGVSVGSPASAVQRRDANNPDAYATMASDQDWGMLVYCQGRLVWPYVRFSAHEVATYKRESYVVPVVGIVEADSWVANPNAQGFTKTDLLTRSKTAIERNMTKYITQFWSPVTGEPQHVMRRPHVWARCDNCHAWRIVANPPTTNMCDVHVVPKWHCELNKGGTTKCNGDDDEFEGVPGKTKKGKARQQLPAAAPMPHYPQAGVTVPKRARPIVKVPDRDAVKRIRVGNEWHEVTPAPSPQSDSLSEQQAAAFANAEECVSPGPVAQQHHQMALPAVVGSLPPHGTVGDDGQFVPELDLNARTPEPHELPIPDIGSDDNFVLNQNVAEQQRELDRLHVDGVDEARHGNTSSAGPAGALDPALLVETDADGTPDVGTAGSEANAVGTAGASERNAGSMAPASAHNEAAVALVAMNRSADCDLEPAPGLEDQKQRRDSPGRQAESDEVRDAIAAVEDGAKGDPQKPSMQMDGDAGFENDGVGSSGAVASEQFAAQEEGNLLDAGAPQPIRNDLQGNVDGDEDWRLKAAGTHGAAPGSSEHQSEGSKGPSHQPTTPAAKVAAGSGDVRRESGDARRESGDGSLGGVPADAGADVNGGDDGGDHGERGASGLGDAGYAGGSGLGSGSGMGGGGERVGQDGQWRAKFLELTALLDEEREPSGLMPPLQSVGIEEADALVMDLKRFVAGTAADLIKAQACEGLAIEQLHEARKLIRMFLERGVGIVRPDDDEDEPIENHFKSYLRMIDVLQGSAELS